MRLAVNATPDVCRVHKATTVHTSDHGELTPRSSSDAWPNSSSETWTRPRVFGIGLYKTGVTSLASAFEKLGYSPPCPPCDEAVAQLRPFQDPEYLSPDAWTATENLFRLHAYSTHHKAGADYPWMWAFPWVHAVFPDTKFVLTVRSCASTLSSAGTMWVRNWVPRQSRAHEGLSRREHAQWVRNVACGQTLLPQYERHLQRVLHFFSGRPERLKNLLVLNYAEARPWERLCRFLEVPFAICAKAAGGDPANVSFTHSNRRPPSSESVKCVENSRGTHRTAPTARENASLCEQLEPYFCTSEQRSLLSRSSHVSAGARPAPAPAPRRSSTRKANAASSPHSLRYKPSPIVSKQRDEAPTGMVVAGLIICGVVLVLLLCVLAFSLELVLD